MRARTSEPSRAMACSNRSCASCQSCLLRIECSNCVFEIGAGTGERFLRNELQNRLVWLAGRGECMSVCVVERCFGGWVLRLLRQAQCRLEMRNGHGRFACLVVRESKIGLDSVVVGLDLLGRFEFLCALERLAQLHQDRAEGFVSFGDLRLQTNDFEQIWSAPTPCFRPGVRRTPRGKPHQPA